MKKSLPAIVSALLLLLLASSAMAAKRPITLESLLTELTDFDAVARWPQPEFTCKEASSYDRSRIAPNKPGWFANNDSSQYIRTEDHAGRQERVMMDAEGPGAIVRFWETSNEKRTGKLRIYLDDTETPALELPAYDLMNGNLVASPLLHPHPSYKPNGGGGSTLYLPIPYARHCKVTWEEADPKNTGPRYYQINYRTYPAGTNVETFTRSRLEAAHAAIERANRRLAEPIPFIGGKALALNKTLEPGRQGDREMGGHGEKNEFRTPNTEYRIPNGSSETTLELPHGSYAIRQLEMQFSTELPQDREQVLRGTILRLEFDGEETVWCPVSDFAGCGVGTSVLKSWYRDVDDSGVMTFRWVMPYAKSARITLSNLGTKPVTLKLTVHVDRWKWDDRSLHFHANWRHQADMPTKPDSDWNFITVSGRGVLVGDMLAVFNPIPAWYGEGNEKIWVDGEAFPSHLGTGTEDYYNASWAPTPVYQTPFANGPRVDEARSQGHNTYTRTRNLDAIPFHRSLQFDMEIEHWQDPKINIAATTYWYALPGASSNRRPLPEEATRPIARIPPPFKIAGALECETAEVFKQTEGMFVGPQDMRPFHGQWSGNSHLVVKAHQAGDFVEIRFPATEGLHKLTLYATRAPDFATLRIFINSQPAQHDFDGYAPEVTPSGPIELGSYEIKGGQMVLRVEVAGTNPAAIGAKYFFGLDCIVLDAKP